MRHQIVTVREAFLHCGKALKRSKLWHHDYRIDKRDFPSLGRMIVEQTKPANVTVEQADEVWKKAIATSFIRAKGVFS